MGEPLVSICVPTRNRATYLRDSLATIRAQDYERLEILISDNASDDETADICAKAAAEDPRIRYVRQSRVLGLYENHNFCIDESRGELLCFFHDDDDRRADIVRRYVDFLVVHTDVGVVSSDWDLIDDGGKWIGAREFGAPSVTPGLDYIERTFRAGRSSIGCPGAMIRRSALGDVRFDEQGPIGFGDFVVWFRIAERHAVGHIRERLWKYRIHRKSLSRRTIESLSHDYETNLATYLDGYVKRWPGESQRAGRWRGLIGRLLFWALLYEIALHSRRTGPDTTSDSLPQTIFEHADQRLSDEDLARTLARAGEFAVGPVRPAALGAVWLMHATGLTWPLSFMTQHVGMLRKVLGLR